MNCWITISRISTIRGSFVQGGTSSWLASAVREISRIDSQLEEEERQLLDLREVAEGAVESLRLRSGAPPGAFIVDPPHATGRGRGMGTKEVGKRNGGKGMFRRIIAASIVSLRIGCSSRLSRFVAPDSRCTVEKGGQAPGDSSLPRFHQPNPARGQSPFFNSTRTV